MNRGAQLTALADVQKVSIEYRPKSVTGELYEVLLTAPQGYVCGDLHELVCTGDDKAMAIDDAITRLTQMPVVPCPEGPDCHWCNGGLAELKADVQSAQRWLKDGGS
jgi:hypothetical protein